MELSLTKLPWYAQVGAFVALAAGACGAFVYLYEMPTRAEMSARELQLKALHADVSKGLTTARKLPEFRSQVTELEGRLANLKSVLPEEKDAADLLRRMQTVATQSSLGLSRLSGGHDALPRSRQATQIVGVDCRQEPLQRNGSILLKTEYRPAGFGSPQFFSCPIELP